MSFSGDIKKELTREVSKRRHCQIAELAAITIFAGSVSYRYPNRYVIKFQTENINVAKKYCTLLKKCFNIYAEISVRCHCSSRNNRIYTVCVNDSGQSAQILQTLKLLDENDSLLPSDSAADPLLLQQTCCKRAFLRGAFLASGSMSNPKKSYHLEIVCDAMPKAQQLQALMHGLSLNAKIVPRKKQFIVYIKEGEQIVDMLNLMEAHVALMDFENVRILRDIANRINRQINCEVANSQKTVTASARQREDILLIEKTVGFASLPPGLQEIASLRLEYPDIPIKDLGALLSPPIGKSGVNHRLRKIHQIANEIRK